jgi:pentatricopeptide repeat protein
LNNIIDTEQNLGNVLKFVKVFESFKFFPDVIFLRKLWVLFFKEYESKMLPELSELGSFRILLEAACTYTRKDGKLLDFSQRLQILTNLMESKGIQPDLATHQLVQQGCSARKDLFAAQKWHEWVSSKKFLSENEIGKLPGPLQGKDKLREIADVLQSGNLKKSIALITESGFENANLDIYLDIVRLSVTNRVDNTIITMFEKFKPVFKNLDFHLRERFAWVTLNAGFEMGKANIVHMVAEYYLAELKRVPHFLNKMLIFIVRCKDPKISALAQSLIEQAKVLDGNFKISKELTEALSKNSALSDPMLVYASYLERGDKVPAKMYARIVNHLGEKGYTSKLLEVFDHFVEEGSNDVGVYNLFMQSFSRWKDYDNTLKIYQVMKQCDVTPDQITFEILLHIQANYRHSPKDSLYVLSEKRQAGFKITSGDYDMVFNSFKMVKESDFELALDVLDKASNDNALSVHQYDILLGMAVNLKKLEDAKSLLDAMRVKNCILYLM